MPHLEYICSYKKSVWVLTANYPEYNFKSTERPQPKITDNVLGEAYITLASNIL